MTIDGARLEEDRVTSQIPVERSSRWMAAQLAPLTSRRSAQMLKGAGPNDLELEAMLQAACTGPDHGLLRPYRFVVVRQAGQTALADALESALVQSRPEATAEQRAKVRSKTTQAPCLVVLVASPVPGHKVPGWEQAASATCAGFGLLLAADLIGFGAVWKTAGVMVGAELTTLLQLGPAEQLLGWVNIGSRGPGEPALRPLRAVAQVTSVLQTSQVQPWS